MFLLCVAPDFRAFGVPVAVYRKFGHVFSFDSVFRGTATPGCADLILRAGGT
jgi:hypothetical protein